MPVTLNLVERLALFRLNLAPAVMLDFLGALAFRTVASAWRLGVFEALSAGPLTVTELAHRIGTDERGTAVLLEALEALGYVRSKRWALLSHGHGREMAAPDGGRQRFLRNAGGTVPGP